VKVVIFCGGLGVRMGEETRLIPKPMVRIGSRPILWHIMRYYASFGHNEFILCLGHKGDVIKEYFLNHSGALFTDFVLDGYGGEARVELLGRDDDAWRITFADTGVRSTIAERLKAVAPYLENDGVFLATYGDGLTDAPLPEVLANFHESGKTVTFLAVHPQFNAHLVHAAPDGTVLGVEEMSGSNLRINGGFLVCKRELLDWIEPGEELVPETLSKLIVRGEVGAYVYDGFFGPMDTIKDRQRLEALHESGRAPWLLAATGLAEAPAT
jgi:glucose-1-phosphate cytidylyltransferase